MGMRIREDGEDDEKGRVRDEGSSEVNTRKRKVQVHALYRYTLWGILCFFT